MIGTVQEKASSSTRVTRNSTKKEALQFSLFFVTLRVSSWKNLFLEVYLCFSKSRGCKPIFYYQGFFHLVSQSLRRADMVKMRANSQLQTGPALLDMIIFSVAVLQPH